MEGGWTVVGTEDFRLRPPSHSRAAGTLSLALFLPSSTLQGRRAPSPSARRRDVEAAGVDGSRRRARRTTESRRGDAAARQPAPGPSGPRRRSPRHRSCVDARRRYPSQEEGRESSRRRRDRIPSAAVTEGHQVLQHPSGLVIQPTHWKKWLRHPTS